MPLATDIRRLGFRRWYERQLVESHVYLVTAFLALILLLAGYEALASKLTGAWYSVVILIAGGAGLLMYVSWKRFNTLLARAELFAESAACPECKSWGKFNVLAEEASDDEDPPEAGRPHWLRVSCKQCGTQWRLG
jgi:hypothetical protein